MANQCNCDPFDPDLAVPTANCGGEFSGCLVTDAPINICSITTLKQESNGQTKVDVGEMDEDVVRAIVESIKERAARKLDDAIGSEDSVEAGKSTDKKMFMAEFYKSLPIDWYGAPEFQWRMLKDDSDRRVVIFENVLPADMNDPWFYAALLRSKRVLMEFPRSAGKIEANFDNLYGRVEAYFQSDHPIAYCAVNNLVHIRTGAHRLKIYLPQTKWVRRYKDILESRLGRMREPMKSMRYLIIKPIGEEVTERQIREIAFRDYPIDNVRFEKDILEQRMAILLFPSAREAVTAHFNNDFVHFGSPTSPNDYRKVYYPNVDFHGWDKIALPALETDHHCLLTYKEFIACTQSKRNEQERDKLGKISAASGTRQNRSGYGRGAQERKRLAEAERLNKVIKSSDGGTASNENQKHTTAEEVNKQFEKEDSRPPACEGIKAAEKNVPVTRNLQTKPTFPKKPGKSFNDPKRSTDDEIGGTPRKRRRGGRYRRRRYSRPESSSSSFRSISPFAIPPVAGRYGGGGYRVEPWRRPPQPAPFPYGPAFDSYGYADARRRKPPSKLPVMDVAVADASAPPLRPAVPLNGLPLIERRKELDLQEHILRQQKVIDDLSKKLSTQSSAQDYMRHPEARDPYAAGQAPSTSSSSSATSSATSKMPAWVTPSIYSQSGSAEAYEAWR